MIRRTVINAAVLGAVALCSIASAWTDDASLRGRIVAIGIPGIAAISPVGWGKNSIDARVPRNHSKYSRRSRVVHGIQWLCASA